ncbi:hypothetical protein NC653_027166 [Populus alba x Populus x berolinensis]|uniref:Uncharacterized protein n=1 Tax=Populus alba x Populus x berolinensis TaxID=444605 RepID=A0AAD6M7A7_9ROSI|nr:hypothetical protein NC653_027166 [Populus alba x Populus x berolinensis]
MEGTAEGTSIVGWVRSVWNITKDINRIADSSLGEKFLSSYSIKD